MTIELKAQRQDYREGGILLLSLWQVSATPQEDVSSATAWLPAFLERWCTLVREGCEAWLLPRLKRAYLDDPSPRKRFTHRTCEVHATVTPKPSRSLFGSDCLRLERRVTLTDRGECVTLFADTDTLLFPLGVLIR